MVDSGLGSILGDINKDRIHQIPIKSTMDFAWAGILLFMRINCFMSDGLVH